ncbi:MAG: hypothetical protein JXA14_10605 [Anaerolineae bacterium]|nr:hypothetical protein [Anaerolineae bacterium]
MDTHNRSTKGWLTVTTIATCVVLTITWLVALPQTAEALPPRPEVPSPPDDVEPSTQAQAQIQLQVRFPDSWPWQTTHWQNLWTVVQWQDPTGAWHDVEGWRGTLDEVKSSESGAVTGYKTWWVGGEHMGEGPFRWLVYHGKGGWLLATSEPFDLPSINKASLVVEVSLVR